jgi:hypothetical protein
LGEVLKRAAHLRMGERAKAAHEQQSVDTNRLQMCHLRCHLLRRADQRAADGFECIVAPAASDAAGELLEPFVGVFFRRSTSRDVQQAPCACAQEQE